MDIYALEIQMLTEQRDNKRLRQVRGQGGGEGRGGKAGGSQSLWVNLYVNLYEAHDLSLVGAFASPASLASKFSVTPVLDLW